MKYKKPPLTFRKQAELIISRGLIADSENLIQILESVSYYRLSGYWYPFLLSDNTFKPNTNLESIWRRYRFDRQLRVLIMDAIERVEIAIRSQLTNAFTLKYGAFGYLDKTNLPNLSVKRHNYFKDRIKEEEQRSKEQFVSHFFTKYGDKHNELPLWMIAELMPFGMTLTFYRGIDDNLKKELATIYGVSDRVLESWLKALNVIRNICAHHGRLWNRELGYKPMIPRKNKHKKWHTPTTPQNNRIFSIILILKYILNITASESGWSLRLEGLLENYNDIPLIPMGFPDNWKESPIWKNEEVSH